MSPRSIPLYFLLALLPAISEAQQTTRQNVNPEVILIGVGVSLFVCIIVLGRIILTLRLLPWWMTPWRRRPKTVSRTSRDAEIGLTNIVTQTSSSSQPGRSLSTPAEEDIVDLRLGQVSRSLTSSSAPSRSPHRSGSGASTFSRPPRRSGSVTSTSSRAPRSSRSPSEAVPPRVIVVNGRMVVVDPQRSTNGNRLRVAEEAEAESRARRENESVEQLPRYEPQREGEVIPSYEPMREEEVGSAMRGEGREDERVAGQTGQIETAGQAGPAPPAPEPGELPPPYYTP